MLLKQYNSQLVIPTWLLRLPNYFRILASTSIAKCMSLNYFPSWSPCQSVHYHWVIYWYIVFNFNFFVHFFWHRGKCSYKLKITTSIFNFMSVVHNIFILVQSIVWWDWHLLFWKFLDHYFMKSNLRETCLLVANLENNKSLDSSNARKINFYKKHNLCYDPLINLKIIVLQQR